MAGAFLVLEGPDGAGKSTQARRLAAALAARGPAPLLVREPGGTPIGEKVRAILLDPANAALDARAELLLFMASRAQLCREVVRPALEAGRVVIADRFLASSAVYQGVAGGLGIEKVLEVGLFATGGLVPDLTILLEIPADEAARRVAGARAKDRIEARSLDFHRAVAEGYRRYAAIARERVVRVDAAQPEDAVAREVERLVGEVVKEGAAA
jgi:dTMP kinase